MHSQRRTDQARTRGDSRKLAVRTASYRASTARISWLPNIDQNNELPTYRVFRNGALARTTTGSSRFGQRPSVDRVDSGLAVGSAHADCVTVTADSVSYCHRLRESSGTAKSKLSGPVGNTTQSLGDITPVNAAAGSGGPRNAAGAVEGDSNMVSQYTGSSSGSTVSSQQACSDDATGAETRFTTMTASDKRIGFDNSGSVTGNSSTGDKSPA